MARVPYIQKSDASGELKKVYDGLEHEFNARGRGGIPNVFKALANSPELAGRIFPLASYFMTRSTLDARVRELAVLMLMKRLNCEYGFVRHESIAASVGITREQIDQIGSYQTSQSFSADDKQVLRYADDLTVKAQVDDQLFAQLEKRLGRQNLVDLTGAISFWNMMARNLNALKVELES